jgi:CO/xanthine dehydrogenase Mo-binding subunit
MDAHPKGMLWARILTAPMAARGWRKSTLKRAACARFQSDYRRSAVRKNYSFAGQPVCAIAASSEDAADDVIRALNAQWDAQPANATIEKTLRNVSNGIATDGVLGEERKNEKGDVTAALAAAPARVEGRYRVPTQHHVCLEPHGHTIAPNQGDKKLMVWATTQGVQGVH